MVQKHQSRPVHGRLGCDMLPGASQPASTFITTQTQSLIARHLGFDWLSRLAMLANEGGCNG